MSTNYLFGVDVSEHQGLIDWSTVKAGPTQFSFIKAFENRKDNQFDRNLGELERVGIPFGIYCFARPGRFAPDVQARALHRAAPNCGRLGPVLDMEDAGGLSKEDLDAWCVKFMETCEFLYGKRSIFYSYTSFIASKLPGGAKSLECPVWVADYGKNDGKNYGVHVPFPHLIHQYSSKGRVAGISGDVDVNVADPSLLYSAPLNPVTITEAKMRVPNAVDATLVAGKQGSGVLGQDPVWVAGADGGVFAFNSAEFFGSLPALGITLNPDQQIVAIVSAHTGAGYWLFGKDGGVFAFGYARMRGRPEASNLRSVVGASAFGTGYKILFDDGLVATYA